jgi:hypothetical protein
MTTLDATTTPSNQDHHPSLRVDGKISLITGAASGLVNPMT